MVSSIRNRDLKPIFIEKELRKMNRNSSRIVKICVFTSLGLLVLIALGIGIFANAYGGGKGAARGKNGRNSSQPVDFHNCKTVKEVAELATSAYSKSELPVLSEDLCEYVVGLDGWETLTADQAYTVGRMLEGYSRRLVLSNEQQGQNGMWNMFHMNVLLRDTGCVCINDAMAATGKYDGEASALVAVVHNGETEGMNIPEPGKSYPVSEHPEFSDFAHLMWDRSIAPAEGSSIEHVLDIWGGVIPGRDDRYFSCDSIGAVLSYTRERYGDGELPVISDRCRNYIKSLEGFELLAGEDEALIKRLLSE